MLYLLHTFHANANTSRRCCHLVQARHAGPLVVTVTVTAIATFIRSGMQWLTSSQPRRRLPSHRGMRLPQRTHIHTLIEAALGRKAWLRPRRRRWIEGEEEGNTPNFVLW